MYLARSSPTVLTWFMDASLSGLQRPHSGTPRPPGASTPSRPILPSSWFTPRESHPWPSGPFHVHPLTGCAGSSRPGNASAVDPDMLAVALDHLAGGDMARVARRQTRTRDQRRLDERQSLFCDHPVRLERRIRSASGETGQAQLDPLL